ncbi:MAG: hypothetical protein ACFC03_02405 [Candidatus Malihini olakiniferum]
MLTGKSDESKLAILFVSILPVDSSLPFLTPYIIPSRNNECFCILHHDGGDNLLTSLVRTFMDGRKTIKWEVKIKVVKVEMRDKVHIDSKPE